MTFLVMMLWAILYDKRFPISTTGNTQVWLGFFVCLFVFCFFFCLFFFFLFSNLEVFIAENICVYFIHKGGTVLYTVDSLNGVPLVV